jgi:hypothetical protein
MRIAKTALLTLFVLATPAYGQSLYSTQGLGVPVEPVDGRARALGGIGLGLLGPNVSLTSPATPAGMRARGIAGAFQPSRRTMTFEGAEGTVEATRFPLMRLLYPIGGRGTASVGYGGFLDQSWAVSTATTVALEDRTVTATDLVESTGGIAQLTADFAYQLTPALAVGLGAGAYTGGVERRITRTFDEAVEPPVRDFTTDLSWSYDAPLLRAGVRWDPMTMLRVAGSVTWAGELNVEAEGDGDSFTADMPLQVAVGASGFLAPRLLLALSTRWAGWSSAADAFTADDGAETVGDTWEVGTGIEWEGMGSGDRRYPVRLGFHYGQLPFMLEGATPTEWSLAAGLGMRLAQEDAGPLATVDLALERGGRSSGATPDLEESFWRATVSLNLFGR